MLDKMVKGLYYVEMKTKKNAIESISFHLVRIMNKHSFLEEQPIHFAADVVLTPREIHSVQAIGEHERINVKELGDYFGITKSAASQMIARLSAKGLVKKENRDGNNKELFLSLTESGWKAFNAHECFHDKHMADLTRNLSSKFTVAEMLKTSELLAIIENVLDKRISKFAGNKRG